MSGELDVTVIYHFLGPMERVPVLKHITKLPVVKQLTQIPDWVIARFLKVHVGGTVDDPDLKVVAFSADDLKLMKVKRIERGNDDDGE